MNLPNLITLFRLLAAPALIWLVLDGHYTWAFWIFIAAGLSDAVDGFLARIFKVYTWLGSYLDPLADKALITCVYVALGQAGYIPLWLVILVVFRDVLIVGGLLLLYTMRPPAFLRPLWISKINTLAQITLAGLTLAGLGLKLSFLGLWLPVMIYTVSVTTALSGAVYVIQGIRLMNDEGRPRT